MMDEEYWDAEYWEHVRRCDENGKATANNMPNDAIISVLHAALIVYITECREVDDADGEMYARQAQEWLDKPYSHRNGETEPPEVQGHYWFRGLNTRTDHRVRKWVMGRIDRNMVFVYAYGWGRPEEFIGEWHGPIPEPETQHG